MAKQDLHRWRFLRSGGFDQVRLDRPSDLEHLDQLDPKLWATLSCPTHGLEFDQRTLDYLDVDGDGRIRVADVLAAVNWATAVLRQPEVLFKGEALPLAAIDENSGEGAGLLRSARQILANLGRPEGDALSMADLDDRGRLFPANCPNGDGVLPSAFLRSEAQQAVLAEILVTQGADQDRSGEPGAGAEKIATFFDQVSLLSDWWAAESAALPAAGVDGAAAFAALQAVRGKIDDFFGRCRLAAYDERAAGLLNSSEDQLKALAPLTLSASVQEAENLPLAAVAPGRGLPLQVGINPAWREAISTLRRDVVQPLLGERGELSEFEWIELCRMLDPYAAWFAARPQTSLESLGRERIVELAGSGLRLEFEALEAEDLAVAEQAEGIVSVDKLVCYQQNLVTLLNNFVSLRDFYSGRELAVFQAGTLYIDGRSCELCVRVQDVGKHSAMAGMSRTCLIYCECVRAGEPKMTIVAAITAGDAGNLMVGKNAVFYDRQGRDWDASVVKIIENPISVREAFWTPYRRISKLVAEQAQKMAKARDQQIQDKSIAQVGTAATKIEEAPVAAQNTQQGKPAAPPAPFDVGRFAGIFAAIGLALGAIGTAIASVLTGFLALQWWQMPLAIAGLLLLVSGPSMILAWFKLRARNLGPILDGNGWAINTQARINIAFGTALTHMAELPAGAERSLIDPYAEKKVPWVRYLLLLLVLAGGVWWGWRWLA